MKICMISNSHVAAVKFAWDALDDTGDVRLTFFAAPKFGLNRLTVRSEEVALDAQPNKALANQIKLSSGGLDRISVNDYDLFWTHGLNFILPRLDQRLSSAVIGKAIEGSIENSLAHDIVGQLREITDKPVLLSPEPLLADIGVEGVNSATNLPAKMVSHEDICDLFAERMFYENVHFLWQEPHTVGPQMNTLREFSENSNRIEHGNRGTHHKQGDVRHMNNEFGAVVLQAAVERARTLLGE